MSYTRVSSSSRRCYGSTTRGFRLNPKRISIRRLRAKFIKLFRTLAKWCRSCKNNSIGDRKGGSVSSRNLVVKESVMKTTKKEVYRLRSFGRSNSFYSEAIADCLEFIKRSSVSSDGGKQDLPDIIEEYIYEI